MNNHKLFPRIMLWIICTLLAACASGSDPSEIITPTALPLLVDRQAKIPIDAVKMSPRTDENPPQVYSTDYDQAIPLSEAINTAGAEDSPFITPDGNTLYFFFTPDVNVPVEQQLLDGV